MNPTIEGIFRHPLIASVVPWVVGMAWPEGDEDALFRLSDAYASAGGAATAIINDGDAACRTVSSAVNGVAAQEFVRFWNSFVEIASPELVAACEDAATLLNQMGLEIEYAKYMILVQLLWLLFMIFLFLKMAFASGGTSLSMIPVACRMAQLSIRQVMIMLIRNIAFGVAFMGAMDGGIQLSQMHGWLGASGRRVDWDGAKTESAIWGGVVVGAFMTGSNWLITNRLAGSRMNAGLVAREAMTSREKWAALLNRSVLGWSVQGGFGETAAEIVNAVRTGQPITWQFLAQTFTSGFIGGADGQMPMRLNGLDTAAGPQRSTDSWDLGLTDEDLGLGPPRLPHVEEADGGPPAWIQREIDSRLEQYEEYRGYQVDLAAARAPSGVQGPGVQSEVTPPPPLATDAAVRPPPPAVPDPVSLLAAEPAATQRPPDPVPQGALKRPLTEDPAPSYGRSAGPWPSQPADPITPQPAQPNAATPGPAVLPGPILAQRRIYQGGPLIGDLIPSRADQAGDRSRQQWVKDAIADVLDGTYAGLEHAVTDVEVKPGEVRFKGKVWNQDGLEVGRSDVILTRAPDGSLSADLAELRLNITQGADATGRAFAPWLFGKLDTWFTDSEVSRLTGDFEEVGGYAVAAMGGWRWAYPSEAERALRWLTWHAQRTSERVVVLYEVLELAEARNDPAAAGHLRTTLGRLEAQLESARAAIADAGRFAFGSPGYPTPHRISQLGRADAVDHMWIGKQAMLSSPWAGERTVGTPRWIDEVMPGPGDHLDPIHPVRIKAAFSAQLNGRYAGLNVQVASVDVAADGVRVISDLVSADGDEGRIQMSFRWGDNGRLSARYDEIHVPLAYRGIIDGFVTKFTERVDSWLVASRVSSIEVRHANRADGDVWARRRYGWADPGSAARVLDRVRDGLASVIGEIAGLRRRLDEMDRGAPLDDDVSERMRVLREERAAGERILERARTNDFGSPGYPRPIDVWNAGDFLGPRALAGDDWHAVLRFDVPPAEPVRPAAKADPPPGLDELIPGRGGHVDEARVIGAVTRQIDGDYAGLAVQVSFARADPESIRLSADVITPLGEVGQVALSIQRGADGTLTARYDALRVPAALAESFIAEFAGRLEPWLVTSRVTSIEVRHASVEWADRGADWAEAESAGRALDSLRVARDRIAAEITHMQVDMGRGVVGEPGRGRRYSEALHERIAADLLLERARTSPYGSAGFPRPIDIATTGQSIGRDALAGADWHAVQRLAEPEPMVQTASPPAPPSPISATQWKDELLPSGEGDLLTAAGERINGTYAGLETRVTSAVTAGDVLEVEVRLTAPPGQARNLTISLRHVDTRLAVRFDAIDLPPSYQGRVADFVNALHSRLLAAFEAPAAHGDSRAAHAQRLDGVYGGLPTRVEWAIDGRNGVHVRAEVPARDGILGTVDLFVRRDPDGSPYVRIHRTQIPDGHSQMAFHSELADRIESWLSATGGIRVEVGSNLISAELKAAEVPGRLLWVERGYGWADASSAAAVLGELQGELARIEEGITAGTAPPASRVEHSTVAGILERGRANEFGGHDFPTPTEIWNSGSHGRHAMTFTLWHAARRVDDSAAGAEPPWQPALTNWVGEVLSGREPFTQRYPDLMARSAAGDAAALADLVGRLEGSPDPVRARTVRQWWEGLDPSVQEALIANSTLEIGRLNGLPAAVRDRANRMLLDDLKGRTERDRDSYARAARAAGWPNRSHYSSERLRLDRALQRIADIEARMAVAEPPLLLLHVDPRTNTGRFVYSIGDPDRASQVVVYVPPMARDARPGSLMARAESLYRQAMDQAPDGPVASIMFDYDTPQRIGQMWASSLTSFRAASPLTGLLAGLRASHSESGPAYVTLIGHTSGLRAVDIAMKHGADLLVDQVGRIPDPLQDVVLPPPSAGIPPLPRPVVTSATPPLADETPRAAAEMLVSEIASVTTVRLDSVAAGDRRALERAVYRGDAFPDETRADQVNDWWKAISAAARETLIETSPDLIGKLNGLPAIDRDRGNRRLIEPALQHLREWRETLSEEPSTRRNKAALTKIEGILQGIEDVKERIARGDRGEDPRLYLLRFEPLDGVGRIVVSVGNPDTARHTVTYLPGLGMSLAGMRDRGAPVQGLLDRADLMWEQATEFANHQDIASIMWCGYDTPQSLREVSFIGKAEGGARPLGGFLAGLRGAHEGPAPTHLTLLGHSYGSLASANALRDTPYRRGAAALVNDLIVIGSPGLDVSRADALGLPRGNVWAGRAPGDPAPHRFDWMGFTSPTSIRFGAQVFAVQTGHRSLSPSPYNAHSIYWDPDSRSLRNMARIVVGQYDRVELITDPTEREALERHSSLVDSLLNRFRRRPGRDDSR